MSISAPNGKEAGTALICVDVQDDFLPGGALAVPNGDEVVKELVNASAAAGLVIATRDWHPQNHCSFTAQGGIWPIHCVAGEEGSALHPEIAAIADVIVDKATEQSTDAYSGFEGTNLADLLRERGVARVLVGGLATDYCVKATALDAISAGFEVAVLEAASRGVDVEPGDSQRALEELEAAGARICPRLSDLYQPAPTAALSPDSGAGIERN